MRWKAGYSRFPTGRNVCLLYEAADIYDEHISVWKEDYQVFAEALPLGCQKILDLGCGTGAELDKIWQKKSRH